MFLSLMSSHSSLPSPPMIVALQDHPVRNAKLSSFSSWKCFHPPHKQPRVAFFVHPLLIASTSLLPWDTPLPSTCSDHVPVLISFCSPKFRPPDPSSNWAKTNWGSILPLLPSLIRPPSPPSCPVSVFEKWFDTQSSQVKTLIISNTLISRPSPRSKPWWTPLLSSLRQAFHSASRSYRTSRDPYDHSATRSARRSYFGAIKKAKFSHWAEYLSSMSPSSVWEAKKLACSGQQPRFPSFPDKDTPEGINSALLHHFFLAPPPPSLADVNLFPFVDYFPVSLEEISALLAKSSSSAAPGPDSISYAVWNRVHR